MRRLLTTFYSLTLLLSVQGCRTTPHYHAHSHHYRHAAPEPVFVEHEGKLYELR